MGYLKYKGYTGSVEYSEEDNCLFGKVQGLSKDAITYEGSNIDELRQDFEGAVDDYLALCEARNVEPRNHTVPVTSVMQTNMVANMAGAFQIHPPDASDKQLLRLIK